MPDDTDLPDLHVTASTDGANLLVQCHIPYILGYKSHFFYLNIGSKIECVLYVGNTKMYKFLTVKNHCLH